MWSVLAPITTADAKPGAATPSCMAKGIGVGSTTSDDGVPEHAQMSSVTAAHPTARPSTPRIGLYPVTVTVARIHGWGVQK